MSLREDIVRAAAQRGFDPYLHPFKPCELGLKASDYGCFSDYCEDTVSSQWNRDVILRPVEFRRDGKPMRYLLLQEGGR